MGYCGRDLFLNQNFKSLINIFWKPLHVKQYNLMAFQHRGPIVEGRGDAVNSKGIHREPQNRPVRWRRVYPSLWALLPYFSLSLWPLLHSFYVSFLGCPSSHQNASFVRAEIFVSFTVSFLAQEPCLRQSQLSTQVYWMTSRRTHTTIWDYLLVHVFAIAFIVYPSPLGLVCSSQSYTNFGRSQTFWIRDYSQLSNSFMGPTHTCMCT